MVIPPLEVLILFLIKLIRSDIFFVLIISLYSFDNSIEYKDFFLSASSSFSFISCFIFMIYKIQSIGQLELQQISDLEFYENEEMWASRVIDEHSREQSRSVVIRQFPLEDDSTER